ncbi:hypothetical protein [Actinokineospora globicatena]|uniref:hypothetical protein n=1 Tax=Actinokineospora globicatena TaxID=103729 RepID=UPI0020A587B3|nr:hypothetical protein [Actinokineospora globicatena]MCP2304581.1 hypothetical protein [Actinokineospora globicatena]GLW78050.1 hypothetical protein Aglo01_25320 [Actinokineospora globicatena]GLW85284.1 hypothetical protein Aglo02_29240 [Actinokineospora globicatena]
MDRTVLITGATGTVSTALINALRGSGLTIRALVRDESKALPDGESTPSSAILADDIATRSAFRLKHGGGRLGMIDVRDIAEFAAVVLTAGPHTHHGRTYTPTGPESLSFAEVAAVFSAVLGRQVHYLPTGDAEIEARLLGVGVPVWIVGMLTEYARAYASGWGDFTTSDFRDVTGYEPRGLAGFIRDHADAFSSRERSPVV